MGKMNTMTEPIDMTGHSVDAIAKHFYNVYYLYRVQDSKYAMCDFYCGITNDIPQNLSRHGIDGYYLCVNCASKEIAGQVEAKLGEMGFDIGNPKNPQGNGGAEDSTIVYMAYKESGFKK